MQARCLRHIGGAEKKMEAKDVDIFVRPLRRTSEMEWTIFALLLIANFGFLWTILYQLREGHIVQGLGNQGAIWGFLVANIVNLIGISHVGIAISAFVRILNLERYKQLARLAELVTIVALTAAVLNIGLDVGRIDRYILYVVWYGRWHSPFVWSMTVITTYFLSSLVYLYLAMRRDLALCANLVPKRGWFYRFLSLGYTDTEEERKVHDKTVLVLAVLIIPIMVSVHSVYGLIFGLQAARPGWYNPFMAPYFVLGAIVSGFSAMIVVVAIVRNLFDWESVFQPLVFRGLGSFLGFMTLLYIYFMLAELLTGQYAPPLKEREVYHELLAGRFALQFWASFLGGLVIPFFALFFQWASSRTANIALTTACALAINVGMWVVRSLIVVPTFYHPYMPYRPADYHPTWVEWVLVLGCYSFAGLLYFALCKTIPVLELPSDLRLPVPARVPVHIPVLRPSWVSVAFTAIAGVGLIILGIASRYQFPVAGVWTVTQAPPSPIWFLRHIPPAPIWVLGIIFLVTIPLQICLRSVRLVNRS